MKTDFSNIPFHRFQSFLQRLEDTFLIGCFSLLIILAVAQIVLRNVFGTGILWADALVRNLLLWITFLGAMIASRSNNHINIDLFTRFMPVRVLPYISLLTATFTIMICSTAAFFSFQFVKAEYEFATTAFSGIPVWIIASIIPLGFGVMALRYGCQAITALWNMRTSTS